MIEIRPAFATDNQGIQAVHLAAFPTDGEARLVALLFPRGKAVVSLVAEDAGKIVGHILFSPATAAFSDGTRMEGLGLAPVAVLPELHGRGIGSRLIRAGLDACRQRNAPLVVVFGSPVYYGRFGFEPSSRFGLTCEFGGGDLFQILPLGPQSLPYGGQVRYAPEFLEVFGGQIE